MKRFLHTLILAAAVMVTAVPAAQAQRHAGANGRHERQTNNASSHGSRPGLSGSNAGNNKHDRPSISGNQGNSNQRPSISGNQGNSHQRPTISGNQGNNHQRPTIGGNNNGTNHRPPVVGGTTQNRPGNNHQRPEVGAPAHGNRPGVSTGGNRPIYGTPAYNRPQPLPGNHYVPGGAHPRPVILNPPHRPYRPAMMRPIYRPTPPPAWRPRHGIPVIRGILGLTFGVTIGSSLDYLYNTGYTVDGYGNDIVYLRNVPAMNYIWTDGALYYGAGGLDASSFYYSTPVYDMSRYNNVYRGLVTSYGAPVSTANQGGVVTSTWFGGNNGYITLSFGASSGRYLTTLTMGM